MTIEIDFDVYKALTSRQEHEQDSYNNVIRRLLNLGEAQNTSQSPANRGVAEWFGYGVGLPVGTQLRTTYKKVERLATVQPGGLELDGTLYPSLSSAAIGVVGQNTNGWTFWRYYDQGSRSWKPMMALR